jgi:hypothetical protein
MEGSREYFEQAIMNSRKGEVLQLGGEAARVTQRLGRGQILIIRNISRIYFYP